MAHKVEVHDAFLDCVLDFSTDTAKTSDRAIRNLDAAFRDVKAQIDLKMITFTQVLPLEFTWKVEHLDAREWNGTVDFTANLLDPLFTYVSGASWLSSESLALRILTAPIVEALGIHGLNGIMLTYN